MDDAMRARFVRALESKGIHKGTWTEASVAVKKPDGEHLGKTFIRDAVMRGKGKDEFVLFVCDHYGISWDHVKFNGSSPPGAIDPAKLIAAIEGACQMLGASQQRSARMAREVLAISQGCELD